MHRTWGGQRQKKTAGTGFGKRLAPRPAQSHSGRGVSACALPENGGVVIKIMSRFYFLIEWCSLQTRHLFLKFLCWALIKKTMWKWQMDCKWESEGETGGNTKEGKLETVSWIIGFNKGFYFEPFDNDIDISLVRHSLRPWIECSFFWHWL